MKRSSMHGENLDGRQDARGDLDAFRTHGEGESPRDARDARRIENGPPLLRLMRRTERKIPRA